jgi:hypothetical protein
MCYRCFSHWHKRAKDLLEVTALKVTTPLTPALDGDVIVFTFATAVELGPEIGRSDAGHWHTWCCWHACC